MEYFRTIKFASMALTLLLLTLPDLLGQEKQSPGFELVGPPETASLEMALDRCLGGYAWGIWPRPEKLKEAIPGQILPNQYISRLQTWLPRIVRKEFLPEKIDPNQLYGLKGLHGAGDFIIGELQNPKQNIVIQFQANGVSLVITTISKSYFPNEVDNLADADIVKAITSLVNYPQDKLGNIIVEKHIDYLGEGESKTLVCYGKLKDAEYNEMNPPICRDPEKKPENIRTWWNYLPFWIIKGKIFIASTMVDWETFPSSLDPYVFRLGKSE